ncbi:hypothetical protein [Streptomyces sp. NPDC020667]|uniref:hypothetical protein n=1 Tax=Streptomyces sp. NPDC020667 TaxID=3154895 RepID=UPI0033F5FD86
MATPFPFSPSPTLVPGEAQATIVVLPGGAVHVSGESEPFEGEEWSTAHEAWTPTRVRAARRGCPVRVSVGFSDGRVEAWVVHPDRAALPVLEHRRPCGRERADPRWSDGALDRHPLLRAVQAARRRGDWPGAQAAAGRMSAHIWAEFGDEHPYAVLADEFEAFIAARARDWPTAARLYAAGAARGHRLGSSSGPVHRALDNAVTAWLRASMDDGETAETGLGLAHLLIRLTPHDARAVTAVVSRLPSALPGGPRHRPRPRLVAAAVVDASRPADARFPAAC